MGERRRGDDIKKLTNKERTGVSTKKATELPPLHKITGTNKFEPVCRRQSSACVGVKDEAFRSRHVCSLERAPGGCAQPKK